MRQQDRPHQAAQTLGYRRHLWHHLRGRFLGGYRFGNCKEEWFKSFLELPGGIPSHDPSETSSPAWTRSSFNIVLWRGSKPWRRSPKARCVAIDGKTVRRSHDRTLGKQAIHMVNVWASANGLVLGQVTKVAEKSMRSHYTQAAATARTGRLHRHLDAMGCRRLFGPGLPAGGKEAKVGVRMSEIRREPRHSTSRAPPEHGDTRTTAAGDPQCWVHGKSSRLSGLHPDTAKWMPSLYAVVKVTARREIATADQCPIPLLHQSGRAGQDRCFRPPAATGASKTACIGRSMSPSEKTTAECQQTMAPRYLGCPGIALNLLKI